MPRSQLNGRWRQCSGATIIQELDRRYEDALELCRPDVRTAITYLLGRIAATGAHLDEETRHRLTMAQLRGIPVEMLDPADNRYRQARRSINLDDHPE